MRKYASISLFLAGFTIMGSAMVSAQSLTNHNSNAPVNFDANRIELQDRQKRVILSGNVIIEQAGLRLTSARTTIAYSGSDIQRADATGGVVVTKGDERASGNVAVYDFNKRIITMVGNVRLRRGADTLNGGRLVIDLRSGRSTIDGRSSGGASGETGTTGSDGRVSGTFSVPQGDK